jgi:hypothetical protein
MKLIVVIAFVFCGVRAASAQMVTVEVWNLSQRGSGPAACTNARVRAYPAANAALTATPSPQQPQQGGPLQNQYVIDVGPLGCPIDLTVRASGHHPWVVRDLFVTPGVDERIPVQLFHFNYPIRAPQCLALKSQYDSLFRKEQELVPGEDPRESAHRARLKYADGLLALPNPNRESLQSPETRQMLAEMDGDQLEELGGMMNGLFNLYQMDGFENYAPSRWMTRYFVDGRGIDAEVWLYGNHGTYRTDAGLHRLENVDILYSDEDDRYTIVGRWRFRPDTDQEQSGDFRWSISESGDSFEGSPGWTGSLQSGPYDLTFEDLPLQNPQ